MRRLNVYAFSLAAGLMAVASVSPAVAANKPVDVSKSARVIAIPSPTAGRTAPSDTTYHGLAATNVTVGLETPGVPCGNCVRAAGQPNIGLPWPIFAVPEGATMTISVWFESTTYTGVCTTGLLLKQGNTVVTSASYVFQGGCQAGFLYGVFFTVPTPETTGFTTVIGSIHGGTNESGADTFINIE